ncbi:MAG TPA: hypothetical protein VHH73_06000 [Verrucomicrobiae bacterium]|nr:hypothetical protein [Verrucomicrobiae bacterium]
MAHARTRVILTLGLFLARGALRGDGPAGIAAPPASSPRQTDSAGSSPGQPRATPTAPSQIEKRDAGLSAWDYSIDLRGGGGYRDNVLLSPSHRVASYFVSGGLDATVWRLPVSGTEFDLLLSGDDLHYMDAPGVDKELVVTALARLKRNLPGDWQVGIETFYFYQDQILDASSIEEVFETVHAIGQNLAVAPTLRKGFGDKWWMATRFDFARQFYHQPLDSHWQAGPEFTLGRGFGHGSELSLTLDYHRRIYDDRTATDRFGAPRKAPRLSFDRVEAGVEWQQNWDAAGHWRATSRVAWEQNRDNGPGYYNYGRVAVAERLRYRAHGWEIKAFAKYSRYEYSIQTVSIDDPRHRDRENLLLNTRAERAVWKSLKLYGEYEYEWSFSNTFFDRYRVTTVSWGLGWEF